jgi:predicted Zn-dependent protease
MKWFARKLKQAVAMAVAFSVVFVAIAPVSADVGTAGGGPRVSLIRDAEIEGLLRLYSTPLFRAAGINPGSARVYIINDPSINAFVAGGQRIFVHTGLLMQAQSPNEIIGVLAHETGHIAGGHLARMGSELDQASATAIIGMLAGMAAIVGGAMAGNAEVGRAGTGVIAGSQGLAQRNVLAYQRSMEASADQAALKFLAATGQSPKGMLDLFQRLANRSIATVQNVDPYVMSHPMPLDRIRDLETAARASPYFNKPDSPQLMLRHRLMQAKLVGFLQPANIVFQKYPKSDTSLPARYARSIAMFRAGDTANAVPIIEGLTRELPQDPYFFELLGQAQLEGGNPGKALAPLRQAVKLLPGNGLLNILLAQALIGTEDRGNAELALKSLRFAQQSEGDTPVLYRYMAMAYARVGDVARAELATAEAAWYQDDKKLTLAKAKSALARLKKGSPEWQRANDLLNFAGRD